MAKKDLKSIQKVIEKKTKELTKIQKEYLLQLMKDCGIKKVQFTTSEEYDDNNYYTVVRVADINDKELPEAVETGANLEEMREWSDTDWEGFCVESKLKYQLLSKFLSEIYWIDSVRVLDQMGWEINVSDK